METGTGKTLVYFRTIYEFSQRYRLTSFSVSQSNLEQVKAYIAGQEEHHRKTTFPDELRALFRKHEIEFDERYVGD
jgi:restriction endonuclease